VFGLTALDQATKALARVNLSDGTIIRPFGGDILWLLYVQNSGFAFGMSFLPPPIIMAISILAVVGFGWFLYTRPLLPLTQSIPLSLIMAGATGNLIDRIFLGQVTDFISLDFPDIIMTRFPVFNAADSSISVGVTLMILASLFVPKVDPSDVSGDDGESA